MVTSNFSIVLQGLVEPNDLAPVKHACSYSDDVIISTWTGTVTEATAKQIREIGAKLVFSADPGTITKYQQGSIKKGFNFHRQVAGTLRGVNAANNEMIIRTRTDVRANFNNVIEQLDASNKELASANVTAVCPIRLFSKTQWFHGSDWLIAGKKQHIETKFANVLLGPSEVELMQEFPDLATEQLWTLANILDNFTVDSINNCNQRPQKTHLQFQENILNLPADLIALKSSKYRNRAIRWATYNTLDYTDHSKFGPIGILPYYLAAKFLR